MICKNCGKEIQDQSAFCTFCGAKIESSTAETNAQQTCDKAPEATAVPSGSKKKLLPIVAIAVAAIAVILIVIALFSSQFSNSFAKLTQSPEKYFSSVVNNNIDDVTKMVSTTIGTTKDYSDGFSADGNVEVEISPDLYYIIQDIDTYMDIDTDDINWLKSAGMGIDMSFKDNKLSCSIDAKLNKEKIGSIEMILDMDKSEMYYGLPDHSNKYVYVDMGSSLTGVDSGTFEQLEQVMSALPNEKTLNKFITRYINLICKSIKVNETSDKLEAGDFSQNVTKLTAVIDAQTAVNVAEIVLSELIDDKDFKKILKDLEKADVLDSEQVIENINNSLDNLDRIDADNMGNEEIFIIIYTNNKGELVGLELAKEDEEEVAFAYRYVEKGSKFALEVEANGVKYLVGEGKRSGDKYTGTFEIRVMGSTLLEINTKNFDLNKFTDGAVNGEFEIKLGEGALSFLKSSDVDLPFDAEDLSVVVKANSKSIKDSKVELILKEGKTELIKIKSNAKTGNAKNIKIPSKTVDANDPDQMESWAKELNFDKFTKALKKAGLPQEFVEQLEESYQDAF